MPWYTQHPEPGNTGEPQSVRDAWDKHLLAQAEADAQITEALEVELASRLSGPGRSNGSYTTAPALPSEPVKGDRHAGA